MLKLGTNLLLNTLNNKNAIDGKKGLLVLQVKDQN